jgi:5,10-methylene-tetrahydrofolate dehydrogenase/methenyl tetrahydrofolate cyclohydrolase
MTIALLMQNTLKACRQIVPRLSQA